MSISPGMTVRSVASTAMAPGGMRIWRRLPAARMRSPSKIMALSGIGAAPVPSMSVPPRTAKIGASAASLGELSPGERTGGTESGPAKTNGAARARKTAGRNTARSWVAAWLTVGTESRPPSPLVLKPCAATRERRCSRHARAVRGSGRFDLRAASGAAIVHATNPTRYGETMKPHTKGKIEIRRLRPNVTVADLIDTHFNAYNAARVQEICHLMHRKVMRPRVTVGLSLSGALIPAGLGSMLIPMIEKGFVDYIISTGANLYHDLHFGLGFDLWRSSPFLDDVDLHRRRLIRIYDIIFDLDVLLKSDSFLFSLVGAPEFQKKMATSELHHLIGRYVDAVERKTGRRGTTLLGAAYRCRVPIYTSSPGDSTIGMNLAARSLTGNKLEIDVALDVNESAAMVYEAKRRGESAVVILG